MHLSNLPRYYLAEGEQKQGNGLIADRKSQQHQPLMDTLCRLYQRV